MNDNSCMPCLGAILLVNLADVFAYGKDKKLSDMPNFALIFTLKKRDIK